MTDAGRVWPPILTFLVVSALASPLLTLVQPVTGPDPDVLRLTTLSTAVGAAVVLVVWRPLPHPPVVRRGPVRPLLLGLVLSVAMAALLWVLAVPFDERWPVLDPGTLPAPLGVVLVVQVLGAAAEEIGWRGVLQPLLETRMSAAPASVLTGLLFGVGHFYVLAAGPAVFGAFVLSAVALSIVLGRLTTGRTLAERTVVATAVHWMVNTALLVVFSDGDESFAWVALSAVAVSAIAVPAWWTARGGSIAAADRLGDQAPSL